MTNNTIVTAGDSNFLWGLFLLVASMRKSGMDEPIVIGTKNFDSHCEKVMKQFDGVTLTSLDHATRSLTCHKAEMMLQVENEYVTWADSDALFTGNCSELIAPPDHDHIHVRRRSVPEMPGAFPRPYSLVEILPRWRADVNAVANVIYNPEYLIRRIPFPDFESFQSVSACFVSLARDHERFIQDWHRLMMMLPKGDSGVVDKTLRFYHQLDESCLNAMLLYHPDAPEVTGTYRMDKDPARLFAHFCGRPKPWVAWVPSALRHMEATYSIVEWAIAEKLLLPSSPLPYALDSSHMKRCRRWARAAELYFKIRRKLKI